MKKSIRKVFVSLALFLTAILITISVPVSGESIVSGPLSASNDNFEIITYEDVFQGYYDMAIEKSQAINNSEICDFEQFCDDYYNSGMDLPQYTEAVIQRGNYMSQEAEVSPTGSGDAYYILPQLDYTITPANVFAKTPVYNLYDYSNIEEGDIIYETNTILFNAGHTAIVYDIAKQSGVGDYIQTIEAVGSGVTFGFLDDSRMVDFQIIILRVPNASDNEIAAAKYFSYQQLGKSYFLNPLRLNTSIESTSWYCSEMTYAAYLYAGINIGVKKDNFGNDVYLSQGCIPSDIYNSYNTYSIHMSGFLDIAVFSKTGNKWTIQVINNLNYDIYFQYNAKMCFKENAAKWSGLNDTTGGIIAARSTTNVIISENFFATSVAISWIDGNKRFVTYGDKLNTNGAIRVLYNMIII